MSDNIFSSFIGPQAENIDLLKQLINKVIDFQSEWRRSFYPEDISLYDKRIIDSSLLEKELDYFIERAKTNLPYFHPRYSAQMLKDPSIPTILGYLSFMMSNPNNHAYEGGPVTTEMEMEVVEMIKALVGFKEDGWGHLTSGGSLANLEALWAARDTQSQSNSSSGNGRVLFSEVSHYSWKRICKILNIDSYDLIRVDSKFRIDLNHLEDELKKGNVFAVIANLGSTGTGSVDNIVEICKLKEIYGFHLHIDAAYGGFFKCAIIDENMNKIREPEVIKKSEYLYKQLAAIDKCDSITIDPHKHGAISYGAGAVLFKESRLREAILNTAPYTYHKTDKPNIGMFSLEGSRPGAMAAATYLTYKVLPLNINGIGKLINNSLQSSRYFAKKIDESKSFKNLNKPDLDINCFYKIPQIKSITELNSSSIRIYNNMSVENPNAEFILSKFIVSPEISSIVLPKYENILKESMIALRSVNMKHWGVYEDNYYTNKLLDKLLEL